MSTINSRIIEVKEHFFGKKRGNHTLFCEKVGVKSNTASNWMKEGYNVGKEVVGQILMAFPTVSGLWLINGYGNMIIENPLHSEDEPYITTPSGISYFKAPGGKFIMKVPMVPIYAYAKYIDEFRDANIWEGNGYSYFPVDQIYHGNYQAFEIKGDSMDDDSKRSLSHGDVVNARELGYEHWKSKLHTKQYPNWIIVTDTTILCKQIIDQNIETGEITCHSLNPSPEYTDFTINLNDVRKLFNIVQKVSNNF